MFAIKRKDPEPEELIPDPQCRVCLGLFERGYSMPDICRLTHVEPEILLAWVEEYRPKVKATHRPVDTHERMRKRRVTRDLRLRDELETQLIVEKMIG